jgi:hypothetical protein
MDIERAKAVCDVASQLIESAKVEVKFMEVTGHDGNAQFFDKASTRPALPVTVTSRANGGFHEQ